MLLAVSLLACSVATASGDVNAAAKPQLAAVGLTRLNVTEEQGSFYLERLAAQLSSYGIRVITPSEVAAIIGHERQRALLGCEADAASCTLELANALGVEALLSGSVGHSGDEYSFTLKAMRSDGGGLLAQTTGAANSEKELLRALDRAGKVLARQLYAKWGGAVPAAVVAEESAQPDVQRGGAAKFAWIPLVGAAVLAGGGTVFALQANAHLNDLREQRFPLPNNATAAEYADEGRTQQTVAIAMFVGAGAAVGVGAAMLLLGREDASTPVVSFAPGSTSTLSLTGTF